MFYPFLPLLLVWVFFFLLLLFDGIHVYLAQMLGLVEVLVQCVWRVNRLIRFRGIFAGILENDIGPA